MPLPWEGSAARYDARYGARNSGPAADLAVHEGRWNATSAAPGFPRDVRALSDPSAMMTG
jgi:hypothetical protein